MLLRLLLLLQVHLIESLNVFVHVSKADCVCKDVFNAHSGVCVCVCVRRETLKANSGAGFRVRDTLVSTGLAYSRERILGRNALSLTPIFRDGGRPTALLIRSPILLKLSPFEETEGFLQYPLHYTPHKTHDNTRTHTHTHPTTHTPLYTL